MSATRSTQSVVAFDGGRRTSGTRLLLVAAIVALLTGLLPVSSVQPVVAAGDPPVPAVAIHVSEHTAALEGMTASAPTPTGSGNSGKEWWITSWRYFVAYQSLEEALKSDGTPYVEVTDANIAAGTLLTADGKPRYPIVISLAAEAVADNEIAPLRAYVDAGGFLLVGSSSFTRNTNGTTRGNFALGAEMGLHMVNSNLSNWSLNDSFTKIGDQRLTAHIPSGSVLWSGKRSDDTTAWNNHARWVWRVANDDAQVLATGDGGVELATKGYGNGRFIYDAELQPLLGDTGYSSTTFAYVIYRRAIEWAFEAAGLPIVKVSPWQYPYDAAGMVRHDFENGTYRGSAILNSAMYEQSLGMKGDYYFTTGTLRISPANPDVRMSDAAKRADIDDLRLAVSTYGATVGSHNGGLPHPAGTPTDTGAYDFWHWGPDTALDLSPAGYASGYAYAHESLRISFEDIETWTSATPYPGATGLAPVDNGRAGCGVTSTCPRTFVGPYFNEGRERSHQILSDLNVQWAGEQKVGPFPIHNFSYLAPDTYFSMIGMGVGNWYVGGAVQQSLDGYIGSADMRAAVDWYYDLGALVNLYGHSGNGPYVAYLAGKPNLWKTNAVEVRDWVLKRDPVKVTPAFTRSGSTSVATATVTGATDPQTAIEVVIPNWGGPTTTGVSVRLDGAPAPAGSWRTTAYGVKVQVGTTTSGVEVRYNPIENWTQTNWSGGAGQDTWSDSTKYRAGTSVSTSVAGQVCLSPSSGGDPLFSDDFTRAEPPGPPAPVPFTWTVPTTSPTNGFKTPADTTGGTLNTATTTANLYGFAYPSVAVSMTDGSVEAKIKLPLGTGTFGGGIAGRVNTTTGARYTLWLYGNGDLKLIRFPSWTGSWVQLGLTNVGSNANWHTIKLSFAGSMIQVFYDGVFKYSATDSTLASGGVDVDFYATPTTSGPSYNDFVVRDAGDAIVFQDNFGADPEPAPSTLPPWQSVNGSWSIAGGVLSGIGGYGNIQYVPPTSPPSDYVVDSRIKFTAGSYGGGVGGRLDPATGAHYGIWLYPNGSSDGTPNHVKLVKFTGWTTWSGTPLASAGVAIDANWHDVKVEFVGARIRAWVDGVLLIDYTDPSPLGGSGITFDTYTPGQISVDNVTMTTPAQFSATGSVVSSAFDAGAGSTWLTLSWSAAAPAGTSVKLATRTADSAAALESAAWSDPSAVTGGLIADPEHRWMQYKAELATTNPSITPCLYDVTATYATAPPPPPDPTPTTLSAASSMNPSVVGEAVTYTATVSPVPDGGTVAFADGTDGILDCAAQPVSGGHATCTVTYPEAGSHAIGAAYSGNSNFGSSSAPTITQVVNEAIAAPVITWSDPVAITYGTALGATQLDATANAPGTFIYTPDAGTILDAGTHQALKVDFTPDDTTHYTSATKTVYVDVGPATLTVTANDKGRDYGAANPAFDAAISGFVNDQDLDTSGVTGTADCTSAADALSPVGDYDITCTVGSLAAGNYDFAFENGILTVGAKTLTITAGALSKQYSDPLPAFESGYVGFANGDGPGSLGGTQTCSTTATTTSAPGAYPIMCSGLTSTNYAITYVPGTLTVTKEDARATYTGALFASTSSTTSSSATVTLSATVEDITAVTGDPAYDPNAGDIRNATVTFVNRDGSDAVLCSAPVGLVDLADTKTGTATCNWSASIGSADSASFTVGIIVDGYYTRDASEDNTVVTVSRPLTSNFITGGGFLVMASSAGQVPGASGSKMNFGFNVKYNKSGKSLQGSINVIVRSGGRVYQIKGNAMTSLAVKPSTCPKATATSPCTATFNGKANIRDITDPLNPISVDGNGSLQVTMTDKGDPGSADLIGVTLWNKDGGVWFSSNWAGTKTIEQLLRGGNLVVH